MAAEVTGRLRVIYEQIMPPVGEPASFTTAGDEFKDALKALTDVEGEIPTEVSNLVGVDWKGPAANAFKDAADKVVELIGDTADAVGNPSWKTALDNAKTALETAQEDIQNLVDQWNDYLARTPPVQPNEALFGEAADKILQELTEAYDTQREAMKPVKDIDDASEDDDDDPKGDDPKGDDPKEDDPKGDDPKGDEPKEGEPKEGEPKEGEPKGGEPKDGAPEGGEPKDGAPESVKPEDPVGGSAVPDGDSGPTPPAVGGIPDGNLIDEPAPGAPDVSPSSDSPIFDPKAPDTSNFEGGNNPQDQPSVLGKPGEQDPSTTLSSASYPGGAPPSGGAPSSGTGPPSQLTSAGPSAGLAGSTGHGLFLAGAGARGPVGLVGPGVAPIGNRGRGDDEDEDRETELLGDEEWDDAAHVPTASIGRPE